MHQILKQMFRIRQKNLIWFHWKVVRPKTWLTKRNTKPRLTFTDPNFCLFYFIFLWSYNELDLNHLSLSKKQQKESVRGMCWLKQELFKQRNTFALSWFLLEAQIWCTVRNGRLGRLRFPSSYKGNILKRSPSSIMIAVQPSKSA